jgi:hypothetical protein
MSFRGIRTTAIILASALALAVGTGALARGGGGHGGGGHGGGHGGGGHGGHGGGHGFHFGGGRHFGGHHFGGHHYAHRGFGYHHFAGRHATHFAGRHLDRDFHGRGFRGGFGRAFGWYGPVFWPYAYDDIFEDILWGFGLGGPFWAYGYNDLYGGLFSPYGYNDLAGYLPGGQGATPAAVGRRGQLRQAAQSSQLGELCGDDSKEVAGWPIDRIEQAIMPTAEQQAALDQFANATIQAAQTIKDACPTTVAFAPTGRLDAMQKRIEGMVRAVDIVRPPLDRFYNMLTDEQKARLNAANEEQNARKRASLVDCGAATNATRWPGDQIEKAVHPDTAQQMKLDALKTAMANASDGLANACPAALPATPPARLAAIARRLDVMLASVKDVRAALDDFYNSLNDEQKVQFNMIGRSSRGGRPGNRYDHEMLRAAFRG